MSSITRTAVEVEMADDGDDIKALTARTARNGTGRKPCFYVSPRMASRQSRLTPSSPSTRLHGHTNRDSPHLGVVVWLHGFN
jgi:hypothetical protein